jgi:hypothetical protein
MVGTISFTLLFEADLAPSTVNQDAPGTDQGHKCANEVDLVSSRPKAR